MGDIRKNISRKEMACQCGCGFDACDTELMDVIQDVCDHFTAERNLSKVVLTISSGNRCESHNAKVGGAKGSKHKMGIAADIIIRGVDASEVATYLEETYPNKYGIGRYNGWTHIDVRSEKARWDTRKAA